MPGQTYGLLLSSHILYGTEYVTASVVVREEGKDYPKNPRSEGESEFWDSPKSHSKFAFAGLGLSGFCTDRLPVSFIAADHAEYRDVHSIDLPLAEKQVMTLKRVTKQRQADHANEPGDVFVSLAKALKLTFVVVQTGTARGTSYEDQDWHWMSIPQGRDCFRRMISDLIAKKSGERQAVA